MSVIVVHEHATRVDMDAILPILIFVALVLALDLAAIHGGADSRDRFGAPHGDRLR
jgi:hypothetical protein